jgi:LysM repeat protein
MPLIIPRQALQKAYTALKNGDRRTAHHWAAQAAQAAPGLEEAWLMLAACSNPRASLAYLERALEINPSSQRARQGIQWAQKRLDAQPTRIRPRQKPAPKSGKRPFLWIGTTLTLTVVILALAFFAFGLFPVRSASPEPVAAQIWDQSTLMRGEVLPGALPVMAASPTPVLVTPTPAESLLEAETASITETPQAVETEVAVIPPTVTASQVFVPTEPLAFETESPVTPAPVTETESPVTPELAAETESPVTPEPDPETESSYVIHIVRPNDTLGSIAFWYGVDVAAIMQANVLQDANLIFSGLELRIPGTQQTSPPPVYVAEKLILVSISQQHLWAYEGDQLIYSFVASTGMGNSTRVGTFEVLNKIPSAYGATWNIWMPSWMGIYWSGHLQNGIHALPILPNGAILWDGYLGTPISYGCVVLGTYEAQLLYDWAEVGTTVKIEW